MSGVLLGATPGVDIAAAVEVYEATERPAWEVYEATERTAREQLLKDVAGDPLAAWIVEHAMPDYHDQAVIALRALPATLEQLDDLAERHDWCSAWGEQVSAASVAGAIPADTSGGAE